MAACYCTELVYVQVDGVEFEQHWCWRFIGKPAKRQWRTGFLRALALGAAFISGGLCRNMGWVEFVQVEDTILRSQPCGQQAVKFVFGAIQHFHSPKEVDTGGSLVPSAL
jgi:hypothetical protein